MEIIRHNDQVVAVVFHADQHQSGTNFFTPPELPIQAGCLRYRRGEEIRAHFHTIDSPRTVKEAVEIAIVQSGSCEVSLYTNEAILVSSHTLKTGDALVMLRGGHSFRMLEDTLLYVIKQGPYVAGEDKIFV